MRKVSLAFTLVCALVVGVALTSPIAHAAPALSAPVAGGYARVANAACLRLRTGPGTGYPIVTCMRQGEIVHVLSGPSNGVWYRVSYQNATGYSSGAYLVNTGLAGASIASHYARVIVVSLARQQVEAYQNGRLVLIAAATTGQPALPTPVGITTVTAKRTNIWFISPWPPGSPYYYSPAFIHEAMLFRSGGYYLHDASWRPYYGYGTSVRHLDPDGVWRTGSHGCVNLPQWAASQLYAWVTLGTVVDVVSW